MTVDPKIVPLFHLLAQNLQQLKRDQKAKRGRPFVFSWQALILFFSAMALKHKYSFRAMERYAKTRYKRYGFSRAPSRQTLKRRFHQLVGIAERLIPALAQDSRGLDERFRAEVTYVDGSLFWAKGRAWHKSQMQSGKEPHPSVDVEASWYKSGRKKWVYGHSLHLVVNEARFPCSALVETACTKEATKLLDLFKPIREHTLMTVADKGYRKINHISALWDKLQVFLLTSGIYTSRGERKAWYNQFLRMPSSKEVYIKRGTAVEGAFSLIKQLLDLTGEKQLPYRGLGLVRPFLLVGVLATQLTMIFNSIYGLPLRTTEPFVQTLE